MEIRRIIMFVSKHSIKANAPNREYQFIKSTFKFKGSSKNQNSTECRNDEKSQAIVEQIQLNCSLGEHFANANMIKLS